jgi:hypothetical protein
MSNDELKIIIKILESKETKSNAIFYQKYSEAADARDRERVYESKLINFLGYKKLDSNTKEKILNEYFIKKLGIEYSKKITPEIKKYIFRQIKLNELGI